MNKFKVGDIVVTNENNEFSWGAGHKGRVVRGGYTFFVDHTGLDEITDNRGDTDGQRWTYQEDWLDKVEEPMYDKQKVAEFKEMLKKYIDTHLVEAGWWEGGETIRTRRLLDWLDKQVAPEYPCPVCGEEMEVRPLMPISITGYCREEGCPMGYTKYYPLEPSLHKALQGRAHE